MQCNFTIAVPWGRAARFTRSWSSFGTSGNSYAQFLFGRAPNQAPKAAAFSPLFSSSSVVRRAAEKNTAGFLGSCALLFGAFTPATVSQRTGGVCCVVPAAQQRRGFAAPTTLSRYLGMRRKRSPPLEPRFNGNLHRPIEKRKFPYFGGRLRKTAAKAPFRYSVDSRFASTQSFIVEYTFPTAPAFRALVQVLPRYLPGATVEGQGCTVVCTYDSTVRSPYMPFIRVTRMEDSLVLFDSSASPDYREFQDNSNYVTHVVQRVLDTLEQAKPMCTQR